jgi:hypothetical protein
MFNQIYDAIRRYVYPVILIVGLLACVAWSIQPLRAAMVSKGLIDDKSVFSILGVMITITLFELQQHEKRLKELDRSINLFSPSDGSQIVSGGVGQVYNHLNPVLSKMAGSGRDATSIDVLGLTLFSAWPIALRPNIRDGKFRNCTINLYCLDADFLRSHPTLFSEEWVDQASSKPLEIERFTKDESALLAKNQVAVNLRKYSFFPGVHGFRTSDGHLMLSFIHWSTVTYRVEDPEQFYEVFLPSDTSVRAKVFRDLFDNWINRAKR